MSLKDAALRLLRGRVPAHPVGFVRAFIGAAVLLRGGEAWDILSAVLNPESIQLPYMPGVPGLSLAGVPWIIGTWMATGVAFMVGWHTRIAGFILTAVMAYVLMLDQQTYSSHLYLMVLVVLLLSIADSGVAFSCDSRKVQTETITAWPVLLLSIQLSLVYFFAAVTKLNYSYLSGELLGRALRPSLFELLAGSRQEFLLSFLSCVGVATELFLAFSLWVPRLKIVTIIAGFGLHISMMFTLTLSVGLQLQVFAIVSLTLYALPRRLL